jgi:hypothetical protein
MHAHDRVPGNVEHEMQVGYRGQPKAVDLARVSEALHKQRPPPRFIPAAIRPPYKVRRIETGIRFHIEVGRVEHPPSLTF